MRDIARSDQQQQQQQQQLPQPKRLKLIVCVFTDAHFTISPKIIPILLSIPL
jgi:hypothetical protein